MDDKVKPNFEEITHQFVNETMNDKMMPGDIVNVFVESVIVNSQVIKKGGLEGLLTYPFRRLDEINGNHELLRKLTISDTSLEIELNISGEIFATRKPDDSDFANAIIGGFQSSFEDLKLRLYNFDGDFFYELGNIDNNESTQSDNESENDVERNIVLIATVSVSGCIAFVIALIFIWLKLRRRRRRRPRITQAKLHRAGVDFLRQNAPIAGKNFEENSFDSGHSWVWHDPHEQGNQEERESFSTQQTFDRQFRNSLDNTQSNLSPNRYHRNARDINPKTQKSDSRNSPIKGSSDGYDNNQNQNRPRRKNLNSHKDSAQVRKTKQRDRSPISPSKSPQSSLGLNVSPEALFEAQRQSQRYSFVVDGTNQSIASSSAQGHNQEQPPQQAQQYIGPNFNNNQMAQTFHTSSSYGKPPTTLTKYECFAPPGPLGIIIDTTINGPKIHTVKSGSPLLGLITPGDLVVGLDDVDTSQLEAQELTRLMASKAQEPQRKITLRSQA